jgi:hypothetical protein
MRRSAILSAIVVATLVLVGCSSGGTATPAATTSSASSSATTSSSAATTTVGGDTTELDAQTTAWFNTLCKGLSPFADMTAGNLNVTSTEELSALMTSVGEAFTETGAELEQLPPPTFEGGAQVASELQSALQQGGQIFKDYGERAATIPANDEAAGQQFFADFQAELGKLEFANFEPSPAVQEAVQAIPSCAPIFGS